MQLRNFFLQVAELRLQLKKKYPPGHLWIVHTHAPLVDILHEALGEYFLYKLTCKLNYNKKKHVHKILS
jgi:hypothetical protein